MHVALTFFLAAAVVSLAAGRLHLPYTIALVIAGLTAGNWHAAHYAISPQILLFALILPLLCDGGRHLPADHLVRYGWLIGALAVLGTLVSAAAIAAVARFLWHVPLRGALALGAIASAVDPVSVIALVREAGLDGRLGTILEAEAVFNDAVAIVLFALATAPDASRLGRSGTVRLAARKPSRHRRILLRADFAMRLMTSRGSRTARRFLSHTGCQWHPPPPRKADEAR